jgi:hypothetical protein
MRSFDYQSVAVEAGILPEKLDPAIPGHFLISIP